MGELLQHLPVLNAVQQNDASSSHPFVREEAKENSPCTTSVCFFMMMRLVQVAG